MHKLKQGEFLEQMIFGEKMENVNLTKSLANKILDINNWK